MPPGPRIHMDVGIGRIFVLRELYVRKMGT